MSPLHHGHKLSSNTLSVSLTWNVCNITSISLTNLLNTAIKHIAFHRKPVSQLRDVTCHMGSHSVNCHPTQTCECALPQSQLVSWYSIYLPRRDGRLSWPRLPSNVPPGNQTHDLSITSPKFIFLPSVLLTNYMFLCILQTFAMHSQSGAE